MAEDLSSLKVGDKVIICGRYGVKKVVMIDKITKTQIVIGNLRFRKSNGTQVGNDTWTNKCIVIAEKEIIEKIEHEQDIIDMQKYIEKYLYKLNYKQLEAICQIISTIEEKDKNN